MQADSLARLALVPSERRAVLALALVLALRMFGLFVLLPVLALYASELPGGTATLAGLAVGAFGITQALLQIPAGALSDRIGRKRVILLGLAIFALGSAVAALSDSIAGVLAGRVLQGAGAISAAATALLADLTRVEVRTRAMAVVGIAIGATFMLALAVGPGLAARLGVPGLFWLGAALAGVAAVLVTGVPGGWSRPVTHREAHLREGLADHRLWPAHLGIFLLHATLTATFVAVPFLLRDGLGMAPATHTRVYLLAMLASLVVTIPLIVAVERTRRPAAIFALGIVLLGIGQLGLLLAASAGAAIAAMAVYFAGFNFLEARLPALVSRMAGARARGSVLGVFATGQFLGAFTGGLAGGAVLGAADPGAVFILGFAIALLWLMIAARAGYG